MNPLFPNALKDRDGSSIRLELFGDDPETNPWWSLDRRDAGSFTWDDRRLGIGWRATHGYLVALHEVSNHQQAARFAAQNRIQILEDGGLYLRGKGIAELFIRCIGLPPREEILTQNDLYRLQILPDYEATIGYGSLLFIKLIASPAAEQDTALPDPWTLTTLVLRGVELKDVPRLAELVLFYLRGNFRGLRFAFWRLPDLDLAPRLDESSEAVDPPTLVKDLKSSLCQEAVAFFNRGQESQPIPGFLYFYRVLEACFDFVLDHQIKNWRNDTHISSMELMQNIRRLQREKEDKWALREVLGQILDQPLLERATLQRLISHPVADELRNGIYARRNCIAHGRRGEHPDILVPFGYSLGEDGQRSRDWFKLMEELAGKALAKWILVGV